MSVDAERGIAEIIAANVRRIRRVKGLSQKALGEAVGVRQETISGVEVGVHSSSVSTLSKIALSLGVTVADLVTEPERCPTCGQYLLTRLSKDGS